MKRRCCNKRAKDKNLVGQEGEKNEKDIENLENTGEETPKEKENPIQESENAEKPRKFKLLLENNKIFFEVFSYVFVGVMGIAISLVGIKFNKMTVDIYKRQLQIAENDSEPRFSSELFSINEKSVEYVYEIENDGGVISDCTVFPISVGFFFEKDDVFYVICNEELLKLENRNKCAIDFRRSRNILEMIQEEVNSELFKVWEYVGLDYINYNNKKITNYYSLTNEGLFITDIEYMINSDTIFISCNENIDIKQIANQIKEKLYEKCNASDFSY